MSSGGARVGAIEDDQVRRITPRRVWPGGRALLGGLLVTVAALGVFSAYRSADRPPTTSYVVARTEIAPGSIITADDVGLQAMELPPTVAQGAFTGADDAVVLGSVAVAPIGQGELLQSAGLRPASAIDRASPGYEMAFEISSARALFPKRTVARPTRSLPISIPSMTPI